MTSAIGASSSRASTCAHFLRCLSLLRVHILMRNLVHVRCWGNDPYCPRYSNPCSCKVVAHCIPKAPTLRAVARIANPCHLGLTRSTSARRGPTSPTASRTLCWNDAACPSERRFSRDLPRQNLTESIAGEVPWVGRDRPEVHRSERRAREWN